MSYEKLYEKINKYRPKAKDHNETQRFNFNTNELDKSLTVAGA